jgi:hypothetical protein
MLLVFVILLAILTEGIAREFDRGRELGTSPAGEPCPGCRSATLADWLLCPQCKSLLREHCPACGKSKIQAHRYCPRCGQGSVEVTR